MANYNDLLRSIESQGKTADDKCLTAINWLKGNGNNIESHELLTFIDRIDGYVGRWLPRNKLTQEQARTHKYNLALTWIKKQDVLDNLDNLTERFGGADKAKLEKAVGDRRTELLVKKREEENRQRQETVGAENTVERTSPELRTFDSTDARAEASSAVKTQAHSVSDRLKFTSNINQLTAEELIKSCTGNGYLATLPPNKKIAAILDWFVAGNNLTAEQISHFINKGDDLYVENLAYRLLIFNAWRLKGNEITAELLTIIKKDTILDRALKVEPESNSIAKAALPPARQDAQSRQFKIVSPSDKQDDNFDLEEFVKGDVWKNSNELKRTDIVKYWIKRQGDNFDLEKFAEGNVWKSLSELKRTDIVKDWITRQENFDLEKFAKGNVWKSLSELKRTDIVKYWIKRQGDNFDLEEFVKGDVWKSSNELHKQDIVKDWITRQENFDLEKFAEGNAWKSLEEFSKKIIVLYWINRQENFNLEKFVEGNVWKSFNELHKKDIVKDWIERQGNNLNLEKLVEGNVWKSLGEISKKDIVRDWIERQGNNLNLEKFVEGNVWKSFNELHKKDIVRDWIERQGINSSVEKFANLFTPNGILEKLHPDNKYIFAIIWFSKKETNPDIGQLITLFSKKGALENLVDLQKLSLIRIWHKKGNSLSDDDIVKLSDGFPDFQILLENEFSPAKIAAAAAARQAAQAAAANPGVNSRFGRVIKRISGFIPKQFKKDDGSDLSQNEIDNFSAEELIKAFQTGGALSKIDLTQKVEILLKWLESAEHNLTAKEYASLFKDAKSVFFSVINPDRKNFEEFFRRLDSATPDKYTNATLIEVNEKDSPRINTYANSGWFNCPILVLDAATLMDKYFSRNVISDGYEWPNVSFYEQREMMLEYVKKDLAKHSAFKPTRRSALNKSEELYSQSERYKNSGYVDNEGQQLLEANDRYSDSPLHHNESHILPTILDIKAISLTRETTDFAMKDHEESFVSKNIGILSAIDVQNVINKRKEMMRRENSLDHLVELDRRKFSRLTEEIKYFRDSLTEFARQISEISQIPADQFDINDLADSKLKKSLLRKMKKNSEFATKDKLGKENALTWLRKNSAKTKTYILDLENDLEKMPHAKAADGAVVYDEVEARKILEASLETAVTFTVYDARAGTLVDYDARQVKELRENAIKDLKEKIEKGEADNFLYEFFYLQVSADEIKKILSELELTQEQIARAVNYIKPQTRTRIIRADNILDLVIRSRNAESIILAYELLILHSPDRQKAVLDICKSFGSYKLQEICDVDFIATVARKFCELGCVQEVNIIFERFLMQREAPEKKLLNMIEILKISQELGLDYDRSLVDRMLDRFKYQLKDDSLAIVLDFLSLVNAEDRDKYVEVFARNNRNFSKEKINEELSKREIGAGVPSSTTSSQAHKLFATHGKEL